MWAGVAQPTPLVTSDFHTSSLALWDRMAAGWSRDGDWLWEASRAAGEWMVDALAPQPGDTVLELAAGPGDTGFAAAIALGESGRLISSDFAPEMVGVARSRSAALGLTNVEHRTLDAQQIDLETGSVDGVLCRWGYMLMEDPVAALSETHRVLRDGGRLALSVWGEPSANPWAAVPAQVLVERGWLTPPQPGAPGIFALADPTTLRSVLSAGGFDGHADLAQVDVTWRFAGFDAYWAYLTDVAGGIAVTLTALGEGDRMVAREAITTAVEPFLGADGYAIPGRCLNAVVRR